MHSNEARQSAVSPESPESDEIQILIGFHDRPPSDDHPPDGDFIQISGNRLIWFSYDFIWFSYDLIRLHMFFIRFSRDFTWFSHVFSMVSHGSM